MRSLRTRVECEDGAIAIMAAVLVTAVVLAGSLAVDVGRVAYVSRDQQGATDRGALDSVQVLRSKDNGASVEALEAVYEAALGTLERNPKTGTQRDRVLYRVDLGEATDVYATDFDLVCGGYFDEGGPSSREALVSAGVLEAEDENDTSAATQVAPRACDAADIEGHHVDAVRLWTYGGVDYVLAIGGSSTDLHKISSARANMPPPCPDTDPDCEDQDARGALSVASTLASLEGGEANRLLEELVGGDVSADLVGYRGAVEGRVRLGDLLDVEPLNVGTMEELLHSDVSFADLIQATANVLRADGDAVSGSIATQLEGLLEGGVVAGLDKIQLGYSLEGAEERYGGLDLDTSANNGADVRIDAAELIFMSLQIANLDNGLSLDIDVFGQTVPVTVTVIEGPVFKEGYPGQDGNENWLTEARTSQVEVDLRVDLQALIGSSSDLRALVEPVLESLTGVLDTLLGGILGEICVNVPLVGSVCTPADTELELQEIGITVTAAEGVSRLLDVGCESEGSQSIETEVTSAQVEIEGAVFQVGDETLSLNGDVDLSVGGSTVEVTDFQGPWPQGPVVVPEGGAPLNASLSLGDLVATDGLTDDLDQLLGPVNDLLGLSLLHEGEGMLSEVLRELGLSLTTAEVMGHDIDCTQISLQPSVSEN